MLQVSKMGFLCLFQSQFISYVMTKGGVNIHVIYF